MRLTTVLFACLLGTLSLTAHSSPATDDPDGKQALRERIIQLVAKPDLSATDFDGKQIEMEVNFMINRNDEIVVLTVDCIDKYICNYVKDRLNYKRSKSENVRYNKVYRMKLIFERP